MELEDTVKHTKSKTIWKIGAGILTGALVYYNDLIHAIYTQQTRTGQNQGSLQGKKKLN